MIWNLWIKSNQIKTKIRLKSPPKQALLLDDATPQIETFNTWIFHSINFDVYQVSCKTFSVQASKQQQQCSPKSFSSPTLARPKKMEILRTEIVFPHTHSQDAIQIFRHVKISFDEQKKKKRQNMQLSDVVSPSHGS